MHIPEGSYGVCDHCGRSDLGSDEAGYAEVAVPKLDPTNHRKKLGTEVLYVCKPNVRYRPRCNVLVEDYGPRDTFRGHGRNCSVCRLNYPPGAELRAVPEEGKWAVHTAWIAA